MERVGKTNYYVGEKLDYSKLRVYGVKPDRIIVKNCECTNGCKCGIAITDRIVAKEANRKWKLL